jgi:hypothetical protein
VIRRLVVDPPTMVKQLRHLVAVTRQFPRVSVRILPVECSFASGHVPRSPLTLHTFSDDEDGTALLIETVNDDLLMRDPFEVAPYSRLFERTRDAALSEADSVEFIEKHAAKLTV